MPKSSLHTLIELTRQQMDSAAKKLGLFNTHLQTAEKKLELLTHYRTNYQVHLQNTMKQGIGHTQWHNFNSFMHKLDSESNGSIKKFDQHGIKIAHYKIVLNKLMRFDSHANITIISTTSFQSS